MSETTAPTTEETRLRQSALEAAVRCAQPGAHAAQVIGDARVFLAWLMAKDDP